MKRTIKVICQIKSLGEMKIGEYYRVGALGLDRAFLVKCIYIDLFGWPVIMGEDKDDTPIKLDYRTLNYYLNQKGLYHVEVKEPLHGEVFVTIYRVKGDSKIQTVSYKDKSCVDYLHKSGSFEILSVKKIRWEEGEDERDKTF